ncbi:hypothetical protein Glove_51g87 [Diversispora epigaea]|uniref:Galactose oxidase n=1 Tax=Diversispora epigaea TaxID=1348612 RepID=A0A397JNE5_9GLOM|nr:hypothetical protein Glove_51g87 [Diversispora epigaea]
MLPVLAVLDTNKSPYEFSLVILQIYILIIFGIYLDTLQVYLYNITSNKWVTSFLFTPLQVPLQVVQIKNKGIVEIHGDRRCYHNSIIINNRLLVLAGYKNQSSYTYELFYLDLSKSFDNTDLPWTLIPDGNLPVYTWHSTAIVSLDNPTIFQIGGYIINKDTFDYDFSNQVHTYDYATSKWTIPSINSESIPSRQRMRGVIDNSGIIYIFGGVNTTNLTSTAGLIDYLANILPNGIIVYIGGQENTVLAGYKNQSSYTYELFYLDLSKSFDNTDLPWTLIPDGNLPVYTWHSTAIVSLDNPTIFQIGGYIINKDTFDYDFSNQVHTYDYATSKWTIPSINSESIPSRQRMRGVIDNSGIIYIFGGVNTTNLTSTAGLIDYLANILPNGIIVYIGGQENTGLTYYILVKMKSIRLFDTTKLEWSSMNATGDDVDSRWYFSSVLSSVSPDLAVLDTNKSPYEWSIPSNSKANSPPSIYGHSANLYFNYMIVLFGYNADDEIFNSQAYLYDITSNKWVTSYNPLVPTTSTSTSTNTNTNTHTNTVTIPKKLSKSLAIGLGLGISTAVVMTGIFAIIFILRKKKERESQVSGILEISGDR